jgi:1,2-phenylacetyl-CoA epoxidase catalytic subunit
LAHWVVYDVMLQERGVHVVGAVVAGAVTTLLIERLLHTQRQSRLAALERFRIIAEMNHHIRNALQTISYQRYVSATDAEAQRVKEAVDRIEWALEEILPNMQSTTGTTV